MLFPILQELIMKMKSFFLFLITGSLSSCTFYYSTADVDANFKSNVETVNNNMSSLDTQFKTILKTYNDIPCDKSQAVFHDANAQQLVALTDLENLRKKQAEVNAIYSDFKAYTKGIDKISSKSEEWNKLKASKSAMKLKGDEYSSLNQKFVNASNIFTQVIQDKVVKNIEKVDLAAYTTSYSKSLSDARASQKTLLAEFDRFKQQANVFQQIYKANRPTECQQLTLAISEYTIQFDALETILSELEKSFAAFSKLSAKLQPQIYSCAPQWDVIKKSEDELTRYQNALTQVSNAMNKTSSELNLGK